MFIDTKEQPTLSRATISAARWEEEIAAIVAPLDNEDDLVAEDFFGLVPTGVLTLWYHCGETPAEVAKRLQQKRAEDMEL